MRYAAFLRGINVGGHKPIKMEGLRAAFVGMGMLNVRTIQTSGNVVFDSPAGDDARPETLEGDLSQGLERAFGYRMEVMVRGIAVLQALVADDPFRGIPLTSETRLYVTFLPAPGPGGVDGERPAPAQAPTPAAPSDERITLVRTAGGEVLTSIVLQPGWGTTELMAWLAKAFGPAVTTRNWNTILKVIAA
jgi:uncharacterized protein (DUF1697 family)